MPPMRKAKSSKQGLVSYGGVHKSILAEENRSHLDKGAKLNTIGLDVWMRDILLTS
jgi:hypothetical protein